jgi:hypothetical protein
MWRRRRRRSGRVVVRSSEEDDMLSLEGCWGGGRESIVWSID